MAVKTWVRATVAAGIASCLIGTSGVRPVGAHHDDGCPDVIVEAFGDASHTACRVAWCESRWNPNATGSAGERGLFQIHPIHREQSTYDPEGNVMAALTLSRGGRNWSAWSCA